MKLKRLFKEDGAGHLLSKDNKVLTRKRVLLVDAQGTAVLNRQGEPQVDVVFMHEDGTSAPPVQVGVHVISSKSGEQHFKPEFVATALQQGWGSMTKGNFIIHNTGGDDVVYKVTQIPGYYCCHDGEKLDSEDAARLHVKTHSMPSPDPQNPAGYGKQNYFNCVKEGSA